MNTIFKYFHQKMMIFIEYFSISYMNDIF